jgi:hypothetical protein
MVLMNQIIAVKSFGDHINNVIHKRKYGVKSEAA